MINKAPLFNIIPDNFFSPLSSQNRLVYWECLCTLFATMGAQLSFGIVMHQGRSFCTGECPPVMRKVKTRYVAIKGVKLSTCLERTYVQWLRQKMI